MSRPGDHGARPSPARRTILKSGAGARIRLIGDGDLSAGIAAAVRGAGVHAVLGTGALPRAC